MITALILTGLTGALGLAVILPQNIQISRLGFLGLALACGLIICSFFSFWGLLISGHFSRVFILSLNLTFSLGLWITSLWKFHHGNLFIPRGSRPSRAIIGYSLFWIAAAATLLLISESHPFGEWDAWAIWNLKTKFILSGHENWTWIFDRLSWHTHPDYPLALPLMNSWLATVGSGNLYPAPQTLAWLLSILTAITLYAGLSQTISPKAAFCASAILCSHPYYSFLATSQYADIVLAFFLLCTGLLSRITLKTPSPRLCLLTGLFAGQLSFIKNEGLLMTLLWTCLLIIFLLKSTGSKAWRPIIWLGLGILMTVSQTFHLKLFLAPARGDIINSLTNISPVNFDFAARLDILKNGLLQEYFDKRWVGIWMYLTLLSFTGGKKWLQKENLLPGIFILLYFLTIINIYLWTQPNVDLHWWMEYSFSRVCLAILPLALLTSFHLHWGDHPRTSSKDRDSFVH